MTTTEPSTVDLAAELASGLRVFASFIEANPEVAKNFRYPLGNMNVFPKSKEEMLALARTARMHGATTEKMFSGPFFAMHVRFGNRVQFDANIHREEVCTKVVTGTHFEEQPDPNAPTVEVEVEDVEWQCEPILAGLVDGA